MMYRAATRRDGAEIAFAVCDDGLVHVFEIAARGAVGKMAPCGYAGKMVREATDGSEVCKPCFAAVSKSWAGGGALRVPDAQERSIDDGEGSEGARRGPPN